LLKFKADDLMKLVRFSAAVVVGSVVFLSTTLAQAPQPQTPEQRVAVLVKEVQEQQVQLAANQEKIDTKLAAVAEAVRLARIYASRAGR